MEITISQFIIYLTNINGYITSVVCIIINLTNILFLIITNSLDIIHETEKNRCVHIVAQYSDSFFPTNIIFELNHLNIEDISILSSRNVVLI